MKDMIKDFNRLIVTLNIQEFEWILKGVIETVLLQDADQDDIDENELIELLTRKQLSKIFRVSTVTIDKWRRFGFLPKGEKIGGRIFFEKKQIDDIVRRGQEKS